MAPPILAIRTIALVHACGLFAAGQIAEVVPPVPSAAVTDITKEGACKVWVNKDCSLASQGDGKLAFCVRKAVRQALKDGADRSSTEGCKAELRNYFLQVAKTRIQLHPTNGTVSGAQPVAGFFEACKADIHSYCSGPEHLGKVRQCLKSHKETLREDCKNKVTKMQIHEAKDMALDVHLEEACKEDFTKFPQCHSTTALFRRKSCLRKNSQSLSSSCRAELFRNRVESSGDLRLNYNVLLVCKAEVKMHCGDKQFGQGRVLNCLWRRSVRGGATDFSHECKTKIQSLRRSLSKDYRQDFNVRSYCIKDVNTLCATEKQETDRLTIRELFGSVDSSGNKVPGQAGKVLNCLKRNIGKIEKEQCKKAMIRITAVHGFQHKADPLHHRHCEKDIAQFCGQVEESRVHQCLRKHIAALSQECKAAELNQGIAETVGITGKPLIMRACGASIKTFCAGIPAEKGRVLRCLQDHRIEAGFSEMCKREVEDDMEASNHDWRLKYGVSHQCRKEVNSLCAEEEKTGGGAVLHCLEEKLQEIPSEGCKTEMKRHVKQKSSNIRLAPKLYNQCINDVKNSCANVSVGGGAIHQCLLEHHDSISSDCANAEFQLQRLKAQDVQMDHAAQYSCKNSMRKLCADLHPGQSQMWDCLEDKVDNFDMDMGCRFVVQNHMVVKHREFHLNLNLAKHCEADAANLCPTELESASFRDFSSRGSVITCLMAASTKVTDAVCHKMILRKGAQRVANPFLDPELKLECAEDAESTCSHLPEQSSAAMSKCLRDNWKQLSSGCHEKIKALMKFESKDIRANTALRTVCAVAIKDHCAEVVPGNGMVVKCLLSKMHRPGIHPACYSRLVDEMKKRSKHIDFNPYLKSVCKTELDRLMSENKCKQEHAGWRVTCLTEHDKEIKDDTCLKAIRAKQRLHSSDLRARPGMYQACRGDIEHLCFNVSAGGGRHHKCLRDHFKSISSPDCKAMVNRTWTMDRKHANINFAVRKNCVNEMQQFCKTVQPGQSRMLACLALHNTAVGFSEQCKKAMKETDQKTILEKIPQMAKAFQQQVAGYLLHHQSFLDKYGGMIISSLIGGVLFIALAVSYCIIKKKFYFSRYGVVHKADIPVDFETGDQ